jgi:hypothetical protein
LAAFFLATFFLAMSQLLSGDMPLNPDAPAPLRGDDR